MFYSVILPTKHTSALRSSRKSSDYAPVAPQMLQEVTTAGAD
jgi:hypothetical protein